MAQLSPCTSGQGVRLEIGRPGFDFCFLRGSVSRLSHTSDINTGNAVAALSDVC